MVGMVGMVGQVGLAAVGSRIQSAAHAVAALELINFGFQSPHSLPPAAVPPPVRGTPTNARQN